MTPTPTHTASPFVECSPQKQPWQLPAISVPRQAPGAHNRQPTLHAPVAHCLRLSLACVMRHLCSCSDTCQNYLFQVLQGWGKVA